MVRLLSSLILAATLGIATSGPAVADWPPTRPVSLIVPYSAGGGTDSYARALAAVAETVLPVPLVIRNLEGSSGINGATAAKNARPDGTTLMLTSAGSLLLTTMTRDTGIDPLSDFEIVGQIGNLTSSIMVPSDSPHTSLEELVAAMRDDPGSLRWGHTGRGGAHNVAGVGFLASNDLEAQDVPFKGGSKTRAAIIGGQVDFGVIGVSQGAGFENEVRILALNAPERDALVDDVPTFVELGFEYTPVSSPIVLFAPAGTPADVLDGMEAALLEIAGSDAFAENLATRGSAPAVDDAAGARTTLETMKATVEPILAGLE